MKKITLLSFALLALLISNGVKAQSFQQGDVVINAGIGLGSTFVWTGSLGLPLGGSVEFGITDQIGVGGEVGFATGGGLTSLWIGGKGSYHFNELLGTPDELDLYAGIGLLYRSFSISGFSGVFGLANGIVLPIHIGGRYYFSEKLGVHAEIGPGSYGWLKAGITIKF